MLKKKDEAERFCIDYRKLNEITRKDVYPLPRCEEILESLASTTYFTHLDLVRGYWQIKNREKTAFSTPDGHFQNAVCPHQRSCHVSTGYETILAGLAWTNCLVYLDDIIVLGRTLDEHNRRLEEVLTRLAAFPLAGIYRPMTGKIFNWPANANLNGHIDWQKKFANSLFLNKANTTEC